MSESITPSPNAQVLLSYTTTDDRTDDRTGTGGLGSPEAPLRAVPEVGHVVSPGRTVGLAENQRRASGRPSTVVPGHSGDDLSPSLTPALSILGTNTNIPSAKEQRYDTVSPVGGVIDVLPPSLSPRVVRFALLSAGRDLLRGDARSGSPVVPRRGEGERFAHRTAYCYRAVLPQARGVDVLHFPESQAGGFGGLMTCASVWACAVCVAKITERRRVALAAALDQVASPLVMVTLTVQHQQGESLRDVLDVVLTGYQRMFSGRRGRKLREGFALVGRVRALEVTFGEHGWHPHLHVLLVVGGHVRDFDAGALSDYVKTLWQDIVARMGEYASWDYGAFLSVGDGVRAGYLAKLGREEVRVCRSESGGWSLVHEVTKSPAKWGKRGGLTALSLLAAYMAGGYQSEGLELTGEQAGALWLEYVAAMHRQRQIVPSGVVRGLLGAEATKSDQEVEAEMSETAVVLATLTVDQWRVVLANDARGELQDVAGLGDAGSLWDFLESIGVWRGPGQ